MQVGVCLAGIRDPREKHTQLRNYLIKSSPKDIHPQNLMYIYA